jgi:hypothetical protein
MKVVTSVIRLLTVCNTAVTDRMEVVTTVLRFVIQSLRIFVVCHTSVTDEVEIVTDVLRSVIHSLRMMEKLLRLYDKS